MGLEHYWPQMASDVYTTVSDSEKCAKDVAMINQQHDLTLFPPTGPQDFVAVDIFRPPQKMRNGTQYVFIMKSLYTKLTRADLTSKASSLYVATIKLDNWINSYGIPLILLTDNGP